MKSITDYQMAALIQQRNDLRDDNDRLREALLRIDREWAEPPQGFPEEIHWTQEIARAALSDEGAR